MVKTGATSKDTPADAANSATQELPADDVRTNTTAGPASGYERIRSAVRGTGRGRSASDRTGPASGDSNDDGRARNDTVVRGTVPERRPRSWVLTFALTIAVLMVSAALALNLTTGALDRLNPFRDTFSSTEIDRSGPAVLQSIQDLGQFEAASGYYELVVDVEKDVRPVPSFLAGQRTLFIAAGSVDIGVNLSNLGEGAVAVNSERTHATINLPAPTLSAPTLDYDRSYVYSQDRGLFDRAKDAFTDDSAETRQLYALASQRLAEAASETDELRERAERNTRATLEGLLEPLGFTQVTVNFAK